MTANLQQILAWMKYFGDGYSNDTSFTNLGAVMISWWRKENVLSVKSLCALCFRGFYLTSLRFSSAKAFKVASLACK